MTDKNDPKTNSDSGSGSNFELESDSGSGSESDLFSALESSLEVSESDYESLEDNLEFLAFAYAWIEVMVEMYMSIEGSLETSERLHSLRKEYEESELVNAKTGEYADETELKAHHDSHISLIESSMFRGRLANVVNLTSDFLLLEDEEQELIVSSCVNILVASVRAFVEYWTLQAGESKEDQVGTLFDKFLDSNSYDEFRVRNIYFENLKVALTSVSDEEVFIESVESALVAVLGSDKSEMFQIMSETLSVVADVNISCAHNFLNITPDEYNQNFFARTELNTRSLMLFGEITD